MQKSPETAINNAINNAYQGDSRRVLCVCSAGLLRSPVMANSLHKHFGYNTRSCGVEVEYALIPINEALIEWADEIIFACRDNYLKIKKHLSQNVISSKCIILNISDDYNFDDKNLEDFVIKQYVAHKSLEDKILNPSISHTEVANITI
jgi:predicted protein tyrosine phosphatase